MVQQKIKIICIVGPTAVGKSALAIRLAKKFNAEIISADSQLVYRGFDIGTAKPSIKERDGVSHYLIDVANPNEQFNLALFEDLALKAVSKINSKKKNIFVVGGTGLYIKTLLFGLDQRPKSSENVRKILKERLEKEGSLKLHSELKTIDPVLAEKIHPNNHVRLIRALEVAILSKVRPSDLPIPKLTRFETLSIGLTRKRKLLYEAINERIDLMVKSGWEAEVKELLKLYSPDIPAFAALGYREIVSFLDLKKEKASILEDIKKKSRNYAKRQLTWFNADKSINWFDIDNEHFEQEIEDLIKRFLNPKSDNSSSNH